MAHFVDKDGLQRFFTGLMGIFAAKSHTHTASDLLSLPTATASTSGAVKVGSGLTITNGVLSATGTSVPAFTGASSSADGVAGIVPAPLAGDQEKVLLGDGTWGQGTHMDLLWENASPSSNFAKQTVTLAKTAAYYDFIIIRYTRWPYTDLYEGAHSFGHYFTTDGDSGQLGTWTGESNNRVGRRKFKVDGTQVLFDTGYYNGSTQNGDMIPWAIYGLKL